MKDCILKSVLKPVLELLEQQAQNIAGDDKYKLSFYPFTINILLCIIHGIGSVSQLVTFIETSPIANNLALLKVSKSMYSEAFSRYSAHYLRIIFMSLLKTLQFVPIPEIQTLGRFYLIDGSIFPAIKTMTWAKYTEDLNAIKLHMCFSLNIMLPVAFITTYANYSEKKMLSQLIEEGITFIADRGYFKFKLFVDIITNGAHFIIRGKTKMKFTIIGSFISEFPCEMISLISNVKDVLLTFCNDTSKQKYRIVSFCVMGEIYNLVTDRFDLSTIQIIVLYAYRWQVE